MAITLRKKAPFTCRHKDITTGKLDHIMHPLAETDGDLCPQHEAEQKTAQEKFWKTPVVSKPVVPEIGQYGDPKNWPIWP